MNFILQIQPGLNPTTAINRLGYATHRDPHAKQQSFVRRLGAYFYPRFHLYVQKADQQGIHCSLHLDMKQPTYLRGHAHSGEYEGEQVEREVERIRAASRG